MAKKLCSLIIGIFFVVGFSKLGFAQSINDVAKDLVDSAEKLPSFVSVIAYLSAIIIGVTAILKVIDHVDNPSQTKISSPVVRFFVAGALFALPTIMRAVFVTITGGSTPNFDPLSTNNGMFTSAFSSLSGLFTGITSVGTDWNSVMIQFVGSSDKIPLLIAVVGYLLALITILSALYKTRDHVENPSQVPLKDVVIRYLVAGALFALPTVFQAMYETVSNSGTGFLGTLSDIVATFHFVFSTETSSVECLDALAGTDSSLGGVICNSMLHSASIISFLNAISYLIGLVFGLWGILKIRDHVIDPQRVYVHEGISRLIAGGMFFSLPYFVVVLRQSFSGGVFSSLSWIGTALTSITTNTGFNSSISSTSCGTTNSLDEAMGCFMYNILGPAHVTLNFFSFVAGMIFIMIGISRLIKTSQEGARGPGGAGTIGTFVVGGLLLSATTILRTFSSSLFGSTTTYTYAKLNFANGMSATETQAVNNVISAVLQFLIVLGMISFVRGLFIMRDVAEGKGNASTMSGITHLLGGALAVNLGPLMNAVQQTLGITAFGVTFGV